MSIRCALGWHRWRETFRDTIGLWHAVSYRCRDCGVPRQTHERPWEGDRSLDPEVRAQQIAKDRQRAQELEP